MIRFCAFADEADSAVDGQIDALIRNDIRLIEVRGLDGVGVANVTKKQAEIYAEKFRDHGIQVWSIGSPLGKTDLSESEAEFEAQCRRVFEIANIFGAKNVRVFSFFHADGGEDEVVRRLQNAVRWAKEYGLTLCHENEKKIYGDTLYKVQRLLDAVEGLQSVYDPANYLEVGEDALAALYALAPRTAYFHVKDYVTATGELVPAGQGDGNIPALIELAAKRQDAVLTIEPHLAVFQGYAEIDGSEMKGRCVYPDNHAAFDAAVTALKGELQKAGLRPVDGGYQK